MRPLRILLRTNAYTCIFLRKMRTYFFPMHPCSLSTQAPSRASRRMGDLLYDLAFVHSVACLLDVATHQLY